MFKTTQPFHTAVFVASFLLLLSACEEVGLDQRINFEEEEISLNDTTYIESTVEEKDPKVVLIEEFSGVRCVNCPQGNEEVFSIQENFPGQIISVVIHAGDFAVMIPEKSKQDLTNPDGIVIHDFLETIAYPSASVDRKKFDEEFNLTILDIGNWALYSEQQVLKSSPVNIDLTSEWLGDQDSAQIAIKFHFTEAIETDVYYTILITESKIIDAQYFPDNVTEVNYEHNHVMRQTVGPATGILLNGTAPIEIGQVFEIFKSLKDIPSNWDKSHLDVVVIVHNNDSADKSVLQAAQIKL